MKLTARFFTTLCVGVLFLAPAVGAEPKRKIDPDIWRIIQSFRYLEKDPKTHELLVRDLYELRNWQERLAKTLADLAMTVRRPTGPLTEAEIKALLPSYQVRAETPEQERVEREMMEARARQELRMTAGEARQEIDDIVNALLWMDREDSIRFLGPLVGENGVSIDHGCYVIYSVPSCAASGLGVLVARHSTVPGPRELGISDWRKWWRENRKNYEPIPAPLAALEATQTLHPNDTEIPFRGFPIFPTPARVPARATPVKSSCP